MSRQDALDLLAQDLDDSEAVVNNRIDVQLTQQQFDALVSFTFNVGGAHARGSELFRDINAGNCDQNTITHDFLQWTRSGNDRNALLNRRTAEINLFIHGTY